MRASYLIFLLIMLFNLWSVPSVSMDKEKHNQRNSKTYTKNQKGKKFPCEITMVIGKPPMEIRYCIFIKMITRHDADSLSLGEIKSLAADLLWFPGMGSASGTFVELSTDGKAHLEFRLKVKNEILVRLESL